VPTSSRRSADLDTASTTPGLSRARFWLLKRGSLTQRMLLIAAAWIVPLLLVGGFALDRVLTTTLTRTFDGQLNYALTAMIAAAEIGPEGEVFFSRPLGDQRFQEPYSGLYYQVSAVGQSPFRSRSLWDRALTADLTRRFVEPRVTTSIAFGNEPLRIVERDVVLPGAIVEYRFQVAQSTFVLDGQVYELRRTLAWALSVLGLGLLTLVALQTTYGLWPLRRVSRSIAAIRSGEATRIATDFPPEIKPMVSELNALLDHGDAQAEAARMQAGDLAHALKTPMSVLLNEAAAGGGGLAEAVTRETAVMRRHIDHHLARARAAGRRADVNARAPVWASLEALQRTLTRLHDGVVIDLTGDRETVFRGEKQDLEEMLGTLLDNAAKYGGGRVFVTVGRRRGRIDIVIEDDGPGIPADKREAIFGRGARLDSRQPGTGLGLAIARDVAEIYGGGVTLGESEDLGGLAVTLSLPEAR
jgi:signal transduction histidine kinase